MTLAGERIGIFRQRSFWLRCFLGLSLCGAGGGVLQGQVELDKALHLAKVEGYVANSAGKPLVNAEVTLVQDGAVVYRTRTNDKGGFRFDHASGHFTFRVERTTEYAPAVRDVVVDFQIASAVERHKLYVMVGPGVCADACSTVFTSKHEFQKAIKKKSGK